MRIQALRKSENSARYGCWATSVSTAIHMEVCKCLASRVEGCHRRVTVVHFASAAWVDAQMSGNRVGNWSGEQTGRRVNKSLR